MGYAASIDLIQHGNEALLFHLRRSLEHGLAHNVPPTDQLKVARIAELKNGDPVLAGRTGNLAPG